MKSFRFAADWIKQKYFLLILVTGLGGLFLRIYRFTDGTGFGGDTARDLYLAQKIVFENYRPLFGNWLSLLNFHIPATYLYFLAMVYRFFNDPVQITVLYLFLNLLSVYFLYRLTSLILNRSVGFIVIFLSAFSYVMVFQSRFVWQPHPLTVLITFSLWQLALCLNNKKIFNYILSGLSFSLAHAIYPLPLVLIPYYFVQSVKFWKLKKTKPIWLSYLFSLLSLILFSLPFYWQLIQFESKRGFPTWQIIQNQINTLKFFPNGITAIGNYVFGFINQIMATDLTKNFTIELIGALIIISYLIFGISIKKKGGTISEYKKLIDFLEPVYLIFGSIFLILINLNTNYAYRLLFYYPYLLILCAFLINIGRTGKNIYFRALTVIFISFYLFFNLWFSVKNYVLYPERQIFKAKTAASEIIADSRQNNIDLNYQNVRVYAIKTNNYTDYLIFPVIYYLSKMSRYNVPLEPGNNDVNRELIVSTKYAYLTCLDFKSMETMVAACPNHFERINPRLRLITWKQLDANNYLYTYQFDSN